MDAFEEIGSFYVSFESLEETRQSLEGIIDLLNAPDWKVAFLGIDQIRAFSKYRWQELLENWAEPSLKVVELTENPRSCVAKNALLYCSECFLRHRSSNESFVEVLLPTLLTKAVKEKSFLRDVALQGLENIVAHVSGEITVQHLVPFCFHRSGPLCDLAVSLVNRGLLHADPPFVFKTCLSLLDCKRKAAVKNSVAWLKRLEEAWEGFGELEGALEEKERRKLRRYMEPRSGNPKSNAREFIKNMKKKSSNTDSIES